MQIMRAADLSLNYNVVNVLEHTLAERANKVALRIAWRELAVQQISNEVNQVGNALKKLVVRMGEMVATRRGGKRTRIESPRPGQPDEREGVADILQILTVLGEDR